VIDRTPKAWGTVKRKVAHMFCKVYSVVHTPVNGPAVGKGSLWPVNSGNEGSSRKAGLYPTQKDVTLKYLGFKLRRVTA
jgi:hypothetical protein